MNPYLSWAIVLFVASGLGWFYTSRPSQKGKATSVKVAEKTEYAFANKKSKRKIRKSPDAPAASVPLALPAKLESETHLMPDNVFDTSDRVESNIDNQEFAREFSKVKEGPSVSGTLNSSKKKGRRAPKNGTKHPENGACEVSGSRVSTCTSSTTGADADDDMSPIGSPLVNVTVPATDNISDMLEASSPGVSVLRLTGVVQNEWKKKPKPEAFKTTETKKQRQRRIKNENKKHFVEEAEKQRRVLLARQLHTARESERQEAARSNPVKPNAWKIDNSNLASNDVQKPNGNRSAPLLDTFDPGFRPLPATFRGASPSSLASAENIRPLSSSTHGSWADDLPSEEEQMRLLSAISSENEWRTVPDKKEKRKGTRLEDGVSDTSNSDSHIIKSTVQSLPSSIPETHHLSGEKGHPLNVTWTS